MGHKKKKTIIFVSNPHNSKNSYWKKTNKSKSDTDRNKLNDVGLSEYEQEQKEIDKKLELKREERKKAIKEQNRQKNEQLRLEAEERRKKNKQLLLKQEEAKKREEQLRIEKKNREQLERIEKYSREQEFLMSIKHVEMVNQIEEYEYCVTCGNKYKDSMLHIHSQKILTRSKICDNCSKLFFEYLPHNGLPNPLRNRVIMNDEMKKKYGYTFLRARLLDKRFDVFNKEDPPIFIDVYAPFCNVCGRKTERIHAKFTGYDCNKKEMVKQKVDVYYCVYCGRIQMFSEDYYNGNNIIFFQDVINKRGKHLRIFDLNTFLNNISDEEDEQESVNFNLDKYSNYLTRTGSDRCIYDRYELKDLNGIVQVVTDKGDIVEITIPIARCMACKRYFIHESQYRKLKNYGNVLCRIQKSNNGDGGGSNWDSEWNQESILHMYGYNVNSTVDLSDEQRQTILHMLVVKKIISRFEIMDHLEFLINLNKDKIGFGMAVKKWERDINYLQHMLLEVEEERVDTLKVVKHLNWVHK